MSRNNVNAANEPRICDDINTIVGAFFLFYARLLPIVTL
jgi:hypothetical protein